MKRTSHLLLALCVGALSLSSCSRSGNGSGDEPNPRPRPTVPIDNGRYTLPLLIYPSTLDAIKAYEAKQGSVLKSVEEFPAGKYYNYKPKSEDVLSITYMYGNASVSGFETVFVAYKDPKLVINNKEFDEVVARHGLLR